MGADLFSIGRSSLSTSKKSMETTSHNIANANNENFSRQRVTTESNTPIGKGDYVVGSGVSIRSIKRSHDFLAEKKLNQSISNHQYNQERTHQLSQVEEIFNEVNSEGMNKVLNRFFNSFRELSNQPENEVVRTMVRDNAKLVANDFQRINDSITRVKDGIDLKIVKSIEDINSSAEKIAFLNKEIIRLENAGGETGDLRDQRDEAVRLISEYFRLDTYEDEKGQFIVNIANTGSLVSGGSVNPLKAAKTMSPPDGPRSDEGRVEIFFESQTNLPISENLKKGKLQALIETRNEDIQNLRLQVDEIAYGLVKSTNAIHRRGVANKKIETDANGNFITNEKITGINFFKDLNQKDRAAEYIQISDDVSQDLRNISTGLAPNAPGDNRVAIAISKLQHQKVLGKQETTFEEEYLQAVGKIGLTTAKSKIDTEQSSGILAQAKSIKQRITGVSLDEEAANLVKFQHSYDASARVIRAADEMFDSVLGMMR